MPKIPVQEEVQEIHLENTEDIIIFEKSDLVFSESKHYYVKYDRSENGRVVSLIGLPIEAETFFVEDAERFGIAKIDLNKRIYNLIKYSTMSKDFMIFYDEENDMLFYRRLYIEVVDGYFDPNDQTFYNETSNKIRIKVIALDTNENPADDIQEIHGKVLRLGGDIAPIPNVKVSLVNEDNSLTLLERKFTIPNESIIEVDINDHDVEDVPVTVRFKAFVPNVQNWWLTIYPQFKKIFTQS